MGQESVHRGNNPTSALALGHTPYTSSWQDRRGEIGWCESYNVIDSCQADSGSLPWINRVGAESATGNDCRDVCCVPELLLRPETLEHYFLRFVSLL